MEQLLASPLILPVVTTQKEPFPPIFPLPFLWDHPARLVPRTQILDPQSAIKNPQFPHSFREKIAKSDFNSSLVLVD